MATIPKPKKRRRKEQEKIRKLDEAFAASNLEDQLVVYWNRYKNQVVLLVLAVLVSIAGVQVAKWWSAQSLSDRTETYAAATTDAEKEAFADKNSGRNIGGTAYLELADKAYSDGEFSKATGFYEKAFQVLDLIPLMQRAHLGLALSNLQAGNTDIAVNDLQSLANHSDYLDVAKAEALYHLSVIEWEKSNFASMLSYHDQIEELGSPGLWQSQAKSLQRTVAELKVLVEARLNEEPAAEGLGAILEP